METSMVAEGIKDHGSDSERFAGRAFEIDHDAKYVQRY
jgi:hypothetical protein